ncbi:MAG: tRNA (adenosine(37)-N6)-threonylcarbamoyltransferase complex dimerization subunit type 1 TsaB [Patescibacteria group bacterium]
MVLNIDTTNKECLIELIGQKKTSLKWQWQKDTGSEVLGKIKQLLKQQKKQLRDLKMILVNLGPGSFTGTRVGITIANTLGWVLDIAVIGYRDGELKKALAKISQNGKSNFSKLALPYYS